MDPDLYLRIHRRQTQELEQRLERRRVAQERSAGVPLGQGVLRVATAPRAAIAIPATSPSGRGRGVVRAAHARLDGWVARGRDAVRGSSAPDACCSPA